MTHAGTMVTDPARLAEHEAATGTPGAPRRRRRAVGFNSMSWQEKLVRYLLLVLVLIITIGPFLWQLSTSLKGSGEDIYTRIPHLLPAQPTFGHYKEVSDTIPVWDYARNSLVVAVLIVGGNIIGAALAGFALSRLDFRFRKLVLGLFLTTLVLPGEVTIISQYVTVRQMGLANTLLGVALPGMIGALNVLLMYNAFRSLPVEVDQAAIVDGANVWQRFLYIGLPSVRGTISVVAIFAFIGAWDDFLWPLIVLTDPNKYTLTVGLQYLSGTFGNNPRLIAAGTMIAFIPIVIVFATCQRFFFKGVEEGAVKG
jgi:putative chitobiose transport system permease protein